MQATGSMTDEKSAPAGGVTWVVVADARRAGIYSRQKRFSELEPLQVLEEPQARTHERDLVSDAPGRSFDSHGTGRHAMEPGETTKHHIRGAFARRVAGELEVGRRAGHFEHLVIVASPDMLGELRAHLDRATRQCVVLEVDKDLTGHEPAAIAAEIDAHAP